MGIPKTRFSSNACTEQEVHCRFAPWNVCQVFAVLSPKEMMAGGMEEDIIPLQEDLAATDEDREG